MRDFYLCSRPSWNLTKISLEKRSNRQVLQCLILQSCCIVNIKSPGAQKSSSCNTRLNLSDSNTLTWATIVSHYIGVMKSHLELVSWSCKLLEAALLSDLALASMEMFSWETSSVCNSSPVWWNLCTASYLMSCTSSTITEIDWCNHSLGCKSRRTDLANKGLQTWRGI